MNISPGEWALAVAAGLAAGAVYFGGLWLTVRRLAVARRPRLWVLGSFLLRTVVVVAAFVGLARLHWILAAVAVAAFVAVRVVMVRWVGPVPARSE